AAMPGCQDVFEKEGTPRDVTGNSPLPLDQPDSVWLIVSGRVDLFAVHTREGQPVGARIHLCRLDSGQLLLGHGVGPAAAMVRAVGLPGSKVLQLPGVRLRELSADASMAESVALGLESWVESLTSGVAPASLPKPIYLLEPGSSGRFTSGSILTPARTTVWV